MARFEVLSRGHVVGHSELESGDPPMGVACGRFIPSTAYEGIRAEADALGGESQEHLALAVRLSEGPILDAQGGVEILDLTEQFGPDAIEVWVLGIPYPLYADVFPEHVECYAVNGRL